MSAGQEPSPTPLEFQLEHLNSDLSTKQINIYLNNTFTPSHVFLTNRAPEYHTLEPQLAFIAIRIIKQGRTAHNVTGGLLKQLIDDNQLVQFQNTAVNLWYTTSPTLFSGEIAPTFPSGVELLASIEYQGDLIPNFEDFFQITYGRQSQMFDPVTNAGNDLWNNYTINTPTLVDNLSNQVSTTPTSSTSTSTPTETSTEDTTASPSSSTEDPTICIMEGQDILLDKGYTKIEDIQPGDTINGSQVYKVFKQPASQSLIKFPKDCFGVKVPDSDVYVTHDHMMFDPNENKLVNAGVLSDTYEFVSVCEPPKESVYNILMKEWRVITVNNMKCESLCPFTPQGIDTLIEQGVHDESFRDFVNECVRIETTDDICVQGNTIVINNMTPVMKLKQGQLKKLDSEIAV